MDEIGTHLGKLGDLGGMGALVALAVRWFISDYFKKTEAARSEEKAELKETVAAHTARLAELNDRLDKAREQLVITNVRLADATQSTSAHAEALSKTVKAMRGFVENTEKRFQSVEQVNGELIKVGKEIARLRGIKKEE